MALNGFPGLEAPGAETPDQGLPLPESESVVRVSAARLNTLPPLEGAATPQHEGPASLKPQRRNLTEGAAVEVMDIKDEEIEGKDLNSCSISSPTSMQGEHGTFLRGNH